MIERRNLSEKHAVDTRATLYTHTPATFLCPQHTTHSIRSSVFLFEWCVPRDSSVFRSMTCLEFCLDEFRNEEEDGPGRVLDSDDRVKRAVTNRSECRGSTGTCHLPGRWSSLRNGLIFVALRHSGTLPLRSSSNAAGPPVPVGSRDTPWV